MLIKLFLSPFKGGVSQCYECAVAPKARKMFAILFENNFLSTSQQSLVNGAWTFSQRVAAPTVTHAGA